MAFNLINSQSNSWWTAWADKYGDPEVLKQKCYNHSKLSCRLKFYFLNGPHETAPYQKVATAVGKLGLTILYDSFCEVCISGNISVARALFPAIGNWSKSPKFSSLLISTMSKKQDEEAEQLKQKEMAEQLLDWNVPFGEDLERNNPLHIAARNGWASTVDKLLQRGFLSNVKNKQKQTPLALAMEGGKKEVLERFIDIPDVKYSLYEAISAGSLAAVKRKLDEIPPEDWNDAIQGKNDEDNLLLKACNEEEEDIALFLLEKCDNLRPLQEESYLHIAVRVDMEKVLAQLLQGMTYEDIIEIWHTGADNYTPLVIAITGSREKMVELLLPFRDTDIKKEIDEEGDNILVLASLIENPAVMKLLLERLLPREIKELIQDVRSLPWRMIFYRFPLALIQGFLHLLPEEKKRDALDHVDSRDDSSLLHILFISLQMSGINEDAVIAVMSFLLDNGVDPHRLTSSNVNAVNYAVTKNLYTAASILVDEWGVDLTRIEKHTNKSILHSIAAHNAIDFLKSYYHHLEPLEGKEDAQGFTPLNIAFQSRSREVAEFLLRQGSPTFGCSFPEEWRNDPAYREFYECFQARFSWDTTPKIAYPNEDMTVFFNQKSFSNHTLHFDNGTSLHIIRELVENKFNIGLSEGEATSLSVEDPEAFQAMVWFFYNGNANITQENFKRFAEISKIYRVSALRRELRNWLKENLPFSSWGKHLPAVKRVRWATKTEDVLPPAKRQKI